MQRRYTRRRPSAIVGKSGAPRVRTGLKPQMKAPSSRWEFYCCHSFGNSPAGETAAPQKRAPAVAGQSAVFVSVNVGVVSMALSGECW